MDETICQDLALRHRAGDRDAFRELVELLTRPLLAQAYRYVHDWETARDLTQDTWLKVHRHIARFDGTRPFAAWLATIHRNTCLNHLGRAAVRRERATETADLERLAPADPRADPSVDLQRRQFAERLGQALQQLGESQRRVFVHVDLEQQDQREAARELGLQPITLRTTLHAARRRLAGILRGMEERS